MDSRSANLVSTLLLRLICGFNLLQAETLSRLTLNCSWNLATLPTVCSFISLFWGGFSPTLVYPFPSSFSEGFSLLFISCILPCAFFLPQPYRFGFCRTWSSYRHPWSSICYINLTWGLSPVCTQCSHKQQKTESPAANEATLSYHLTQGN